MDCLLILIRKKVKMKKLIISLIVLFASFEITFAITGVWQLDKNPSKAGEKRCTKILEIFSKTKQKDVGDKYAENFMKMGVILSTISAGKIVNIKKDGLVDFYGPKPFSKGKFPSKLNQGKWVKNGGEVQISPEDNSKDFKFGTFIATVKGKTAEMRVVKNKQFIEEIKLLMGVDKFKKCIKDEIVFSYSKVSDSNFSLSEYKKDIFKNLLSTNKGVMKTCYGKSGNIKMKKYLSIKGNKISGYIFDRLNAYSEATGLKIKYNITKTWDNCLKGMKSGKYDVVTMASKKPERTKYMDYYFPAGNKEDSLAISKKSKFAKFSKEIQKSVDLVGL